MRKIEKKVFDHIDLGEKEIKSDIEFLRCEFSNCYLTDSKTDKPEEMALLRDVIFNNCLIWGNCSHKGGKLENVNVNNLRIENGPLNLGCYLFNKVMISGKCGVIGLSSFIDDNFNKITIKKNGSWEYPNAGEIEIYNNYMKSYYNDVEWALDISKAEFKDVSLSNIPVGLVIRDKETQAIIRKDKIVGVDLEKINISRTLKRFLENIVEDTIYIAPLRSKYFNEQVEEIKILRQEGIAELY